MPETTLTGFLIHTFHQQKNDRFSILGVGRAESGETFGFVDERFTPSFFIRASDEASLRETLTDPSLAIHLSPFHTMDGEPTVEISSHRLPSLRRAVEALSGSEIRTYEADVSPIRRFLLDRNIRRGVRLRGPARKGDGVDLVFTNPSLEPADVEPDLRILALDIETLPDASRVLAFSLVAWGGGDGDVEEAHLIGDSTEHGPSDGPAVFAHQDEGTLLDVLTDRVVTVDPDVITGWNVIDFDLRVLEKRYGACGRTFQLGRTRDSGWWRRGQVWSGSRAVIPGRQAVDAMRLVRAIPRRFDDYRLDTVAQDLLGHGKTLESEDESMPDVILDAYQNDRATFVDYCLEDSRLVRDILRIEGLIPLTVSRSALTGLSLDNAWGNIGAFEYLYITELHKRLIVAPSLGTDTPDPGGASGGMIVPPQPGVHRHVFVFDFKSLYPSIIRTFNIDPLTAINVGDDPIKAPNGARFAREPGILPSLLAQFFESRAEAQANENELASFTYKIIMNSFYGVLATPQCRFAAPSLASAITEFGHKLLRWTKDWLESNGAHVLYGDTDSVFVQPDLPSNVDEAEARALADDLCDRVNKAIGAYVEEAFRVNSKLDLEFEKYYTHLLLPPRRGQADRGRAKGYAGQLIEDGETRLEIVGMEAVRRDWTNLAHDLQRDLFSMLFAEASNEEIEARIQSWIDDVRAGRRDDDLVYRKGLRKGVEAYTKSSPPHVKAARQMAKPRGVIHYIITRDGPQPSKQRTAPIDYVHYVQKQIAPIADTVAQLRGIDLHALLTGERDLFAGMSF